MKSKKKAGKSGLQPKVLKAKKVLKVEARRFSGKEMRDALRHAEDVFDRAGISFFLLKEVARLVKDGQELENLPALTLGVVSTDFGGVQKRLLKTTMEYLGNSYEASDKKIEFKHKGVPIKVKVISVHRRFFSNPDNVYYDYTQFRIPNQFEKYWRMRFMVR